MLPPLHSYTISCKLNLEPVPAPLRLKEPHLADLTAMPPTTAAPELALELVVKLPLGFSSAEGVAAMETIGRALNKLAGEALVSGALSALNPVMVSLITAASQLEQGCMQAKQMQAQRSGLVVPGAGPQRMQ